MVVPARLGIRLLYGTRFVVSLPPVACRSITTGVVEASAAVCPEERRGETRATCDSEGLCCSGGLAVSSASFAGVVGGKIVEACSPRRKKAKRAERFSTFFFF